MYHTELHSEVKPGSEITWEDVHGNTLKGQIIRQIAPECYSCKVYETWEYVTFEKHQVIEWTILSVDSEFQARVYI